MNIKEQIQSGQVKISDLFTYWITLDQPETDFEAWYKKLLSENSSISEEEIEKALTGGNV